MITEVRLLIGACLGATVTVLIITENDARALSSSRNAEERAANLRELLESLGHRPVVGTISRNEANFVVDTIAGKYRRVISNFIKMVVSTFLVYFFYKYIRNWKVSKSEHRQHKSFRRTLDRLKQNGHQSTVLLVHVCNRRQHAIINMHYSFIFVHWN